MQTDNHMINITDGIQPDVATITNTMTLTNTLKMNLEIVFSDFKISKKRDFPERTIFMEATTKGDNKMTYNLHIAHTSSVPWYEGSYLGPNILTGLQPDRKYVGYIENIGANNMI